MKIVVSAFLLLVCMSANVNAATCRSGEAAVRGSNSGYEEDKKAAEQVVEKEMSFSDVLELCVGGVTGGRAGPTFGPSLGDQFGAWARKVFKQVCSLAREKIDDKLGAGAAGRMSAALQNIYNEQQAELPPSGTPQSTPGIIPNVNPRVNSTAAPAQLVADPAGKSSTTDDSAFWNDIWK
ncbi:hypothetical protein HBO07_25735 [Pseudomonas proteolytica]|uniref:hypothetical protein n=1 Tax=Pseudomonas proteolytica TaxID=219574 RepID=UPI0014768002|nr:hypothetical protein [Pseudomonas proteolytica]NMZ14677.1 hypothetical protein [Pseudomonas proteolytica]